MDFKTKEDYRNRIKEISRKTKISEMYIAKKLLELAQCGEQSSKNSHIGYYLVGKNVNTLYKKLSFKSDRVLDTNKKTMLYEEDENN